MRITPEDETDMEEEEDEEVRKKNNAHTGGGRMFIPASKQGTIIHRVVIFENNPGG